MVKITSNEFKIISKYIHDISSVKLEQNKEYLIETRLGKLLKEEGCFSYGELLHKAKSDLSKRLEKKIINNITTQETSFFRDAHPFELLKYKIIPDLIDARTKASSGFFPTSIRIWSAACSTGQEVYSIAIALKEILFDLKKYNIKIIGTDISDSAIAKASYGRYSQFEIGRGMDQEKLQKYFTSIGNDWQIKDEIRAMVSFRKTNLMLPFNYLGNFDVVFCKNVAIYFDFEDRKKLFNEIANIMEKDAYLIIGSSESLMNICPKFKPKISLKSVYYQLK